MAHCDDDRPVPPRREDIPPEPLVEMGGPVFDFRVGLRVFGTDLEPHEISTLLKATPSQARRKGDKMPGRYRRSAGEGSWLLTLEFKKEMKIELDEAINQLLNRLSPNLEAWENLTSRFRVDIYCGLFLAEGTGNEGFSLTPKTARRLAERRVEVGFDLYYG